MRDMLCTCKRMGTCRACREFAALPSSSPSPRQMTPMPNEPDYQQEAVTAAYTMGTIPRGLTREEAERIIEAAADPIRRDERAKVEAEVRERLLSDEAIRLLTQEIVEGSDGEVISLPYSSVHDALRRRLAALDNTPTPEEER